MRFIRMLLAALLPVVIGAGLTLALTSGASAAAKKAPVPQTTFQMYGTDCADSPCGEHIWINSNPNNVSIRARVTCADSSGNNSEIYSGWHTDVGVKMSTPECGTGKHAIDGEFQYTMLNTTVFCWIKPFDWGPASCPS